MKWISIKEERPEFRVEVLISYTYGSILNKQEQTYATIVGKDSEGDFLWIDRISGQYLNKDIVAITHWMNKPDNPIVLNK